MREIKQPGRIFPHEPFKRYVYTILSQIRNGFGKFRTTAAHLHERTHTTHTSLSNVSVLISSTLLRMTIRVFSDSLNNTVHVYRYKIR